jgi:hypothetical protein
VNGCGAIVCTRSQAHGIKLAWHKVLVVYETLQRLTKQSTTMTILKVAALMGALGAAFAGDTALAQADKSQNTPTPTATASDPAPKQDHKSPPPGQANKPDKPGRPEYPDSIGKMLEAIKVAQSKFLADQKDLQGQLKKATAAAQREQIRTELREKREAFLEQQKEMREEFRKRISELKEQLPDHGDVINAAKEQTKGNVTRKGGGD